MFIIDENMKTWRNDWDRISDETLNENLPGFYWRSNVSQEFNILNNMYEIWEQFRIILHRIRLH